MGKVSLEIACFNAASVYTADKCGAQRAELCKDKHTEGLTPDLETVREVLGKISIPLNVMIRPVAGSYVYNDDVFAIIKKQILLLKDSGVNGLVLGSLSANGTLHKEQNSKMVEWAWPLPCTFHRAFDEVIDPMHTLEELIDCGYKTVLTSAGKKTALEGKELLQALVNKAANRITVMPGGGVRSAHIKELAKYTGASFVHSSAITDGSEFAVETEVRAMLDALS